MSALCEQSVTTVQAPNQHPCMMCNYTGCKYWSLRFQASTRWSQHKVMQLGDKCMSSQYCCTQQHVAITTQDLYTCPQSCRQAFPLQLAYLLHNFAVLVAQLPLELIILLIRDLCLASLSCQRSFHESLLCPTAIQHVVRLTELDWEKCAQLGCVCSILLLPCVSCISVNA